MKSRAKLLLACATGAIVISAAGPMVSDAHAQTATKGGDVWTNGAPPLDTWWFHGEIEAGGRFFLNNPQKDGVASQGGKSLAKYYEYSTIKPGPFSDIWLSTGSRDGLYQIDVGGKNIGYKDQNYYLEASKAGQQYFNFGWDQTPHVYSTSARTLYNGVGTNALTLPAGVGNQLFNAVGGVGATEPLGPPGDPGMVKSIIDANVHQTDIGIRRDAASVDYRWTPTDMWDIKANYSHMHRTGTQVDGVVMSGSEFGVRTDVPAPVNDTTQNFGLNGEYAGTSPWGKKFNFKLAYNGSVYTDRDNSYTVQNPFCEDSGLMRCPDPGGVFPDIDSFNFARMSLPPSNQANAFTATLGADLPSKSRYMGTLSYTMMRQNENFLPFTINPNLTLFTGQDPSLTSTLPYSSLNGAINTLLSNNVVTTQITPDLKSKLSYRYYDFANNTPELYFPGWVGADIAPHDPTQHLDVRSLSMSYTRQNAGAELNWHPTRQWNVGVAYGWEHYDRRREDVDVTNENSGKVYADWKPVSWVTARGSWSYSQRRLDTYDYPGFVAAVQWPSAVFGVDPQIYSPAYRQFFLDNRDRNVGKFSLAVDVTSNLRITPTGGWRNDDYKLNPATELGLQRNHSWDAGVEAAYAVSPDTRLLFSYTREHRNQLVASTTNNEVSAPFPADSYYTANVEDNVNTFIVRADHALIPNKLDLSLGYTYSRAVNSQPINFADGHTPEGGQFPNVNNTFQRLDAILRYKLDENLVRQLGWKGNVTAKLRYAWERNSATNWQNDLMQNYMQPIDPSAGYMVWLAGNNPNYDVQLIAASLAFTW